MAGDDFITTGRLPVDLSDVDALYSGEVVYDPGICTFRCLGWRSRPGGKGKSIDVGFQILSGPNDKNTNKDRRLIKTFNLENDASRKFLKGLCLKLGGEQALVRGEPDFQLLGGVEFKANLFERKYSTKDRLTGETKSGTGYEIDVNTITVTKGAANPAAATAATTPTA